MQKFTGAILKDERKRKKVSQKELAAHLNVSPTYINLIENGHRPLTPHLLAQISEVLDIGEDRFLSLELRDDFETIHASEFFKDASPDEVERLVVEMPDLAHRVRALNQNLLQSGGALQKLLNRMNQDQALTDYLHELLSIATSIRSTASILNTQGDLAKDQRTRFSELMHQDARQLSDQLRGLVEYLNRDDPKNAQGLVGQMLALSHLESHQYYVEELEVADDPRLTWPEFVDKEFGANVSEIGQIRQLFSLLTDDIRTLPKAEFVAQANAVNWHLPRLIRQIDAPADRILRRYAMLSRKFHNQNTALFIADQTGQFLLQSQLWDTKLTGSLDCPFWPIFDAQRRSGDYISAELAMQNGRTVQTYASSNHYYKNIGKGYWHYATMVVIPMEARAEPDEAQLVGYNCETCKIPRCDARRNGAISSQ